MEKIRFNVEGMTCAACQAHVDKAVRNVKGVKDVNVNLLTNTMDVEMDDSVSINEINNAVDKAGYHSYIPNAKLEEETIEEPLKDNETPKLLKRLIFSLILLIPLFIISMGYMMNWFKSLHDLPMLVGLIELFLSTIILYLNRKFFISGFKSTIHGAPNMDTLVALGSGVAYLYSVIILFIMSYYVTDSNKLMSLSMTLAFETSGMVPTLIAIGKTLESYSKGKTTNAIKSLLKLAPKKANVIRDNKEVSIDIKDAVVGDIFIVRPGESIPLDGIVVKGYTSVDESMLTGESIPVDKEVNQQVSQGTINKLGTIEAKAFKVGKDTTLSQIIKLVDEASSSKAKISRIVDKVAGIFTPIVLAIAAVVFIVWLILGLNGVNYYSSQETYLSYAISRAISVLVISCPCALGLATPVAIMVGSGNGAKNGLLFKKAETLEETGKATFIILDKTGTITKGEPEVKNVIPFGISKEELLKYAATIESKSSHPLAKAIVKNYTNDLFEVVNFNTLLGVGVEGYISNKKILGVNLEYAKNKKYINEEIENTAIDLSKKGETPMVFIYDDKAIGIISVADSIKGDSLKAIEKIKSLGITPIMLTGDNELTAASIAKDAGIDYYVSNVKPDGKQDIVKKLKEYGKVIMVGDGINDAVALTEANIGMAIGAGTDVAIDSADIILMKSSLMDAYHAIRLSQKTLLNIKENLFWAFIYNIIMIPLAAGVFAKIGLSMKPWYGAAAMSLSSVTVVLNALRLNIISIDKNKKKKSISNIDINEVLNIKDNTLTKEYKVEGMMCQMCVKHVEEASKKVSNVIDAKASLDTNSVVITYKDELNDLEVINNIKNAGYSAKNKEDNMEKTFLVDGMMCKNCAHHVEEASKSVNGVLDACVSLENKSVTITSDKEVNVDELREAISKVGYTPKF